MPRTPRHDRPTGLDRDIALAALLLAGLVVLAAAAATLTTAAVITTALHAGGWTWPAVTEWLPNAARVVTHPADPGAGLAEPWRHGLASHTTAYWITVAAHLALSAGIVAALTVAGRRYLGSTGAGHATLHELRRTLSPRAARRTATWTRSDLTDRQRRRGPLDEVAVPLHRGPTKQRLVTSLETPTGTIAPTRAGKSRTDLIHKALAAPGALVVSTTKNDLAEWALLARSRRPHGGPVWLIDATGTVAWPTHARWSPITGCGDPAVALRRAATLIDASSIGLENIGGNDKVFRGRATIVLQAYLLAAALHHRGIGDLVAWAITKPADQEPVELLRTTHPELAHNLRSEIGMVAETSDAVWMSVRRALEPFMNPAVRDFATPGPDNLDIPDFLAHHGSLFVIAGEHQSPQAQPVLTALVEDILTTAQDTALRQPGRRLAPPLTAVLDELYDATPIPKLPGIIADSAGRGVLIHWAAQSRSQLDELYGEPGRRQLLDNTLTLTVFPGLKDDQTLEWLSTLAAQHRRRTYQHHSDGLLATGRGAIGTEDAPTYRPGAIRTLDRGRVLILHANLRPILGHTIDIEQRHDWLQLREDATTIRTGQTTITTGRHAHDAAVENPHPRTP